MEGRGDKDGDQRKGWRMMVWKTLPVILALGLPCASPAIAQEVIDGSHEIYPSEHMKSVIVAVSRDSLNPKAVQIRALTAATGSEVITPVYCGEVNLPNRFGGYDGFVPFWAAPDKDKAIIGSGSDFNNETFALVFKTFGCPAP